MVFVSLIMIGTGFCCKEFRAGTVVLQAFIFGYIEEIGMYTISYFLAYHFLDEIWNDIIPIKVLKY